MFAIDDRSFFETRPVYNIRTGEIEHLTLRRSHWRAVKDWANGTGGCLDAALADLQSDIVASWVGIQDLPLSLKERILCVLLQATSCIEAEGYGAANDNALYGDELIDWIEAFNPRIPPLVFRLPTILSDNLRMPGLGEFVIPRTD